MGGEGRRPDAGAYSISGSGNATKRRRMLNTP
jgi:hypothetical protein